MSMIEMPLIEWFRQPDEAAAEGTSNNAEGMQREGGPVILDVGQVTER